MKLLLRLFWIFVAVAFLILGYVAMRHFKLIPESFHQSIFGGWEGAGHRETLTVGEVNAKLLIKVEVPVALSCDTLLRRKKNLLERATDIFVDDACPDTIYYRKVFDRNLFYEFSLGDPVSINGEPCFYFGYDKVQKTFYVRNLQSLSNEDLSLLVWQREHTEIVKDTSYLEENNCYKLHSLPTELQTQLVVFNDHSRSRFKRVLLNRDTYMDVVRQADNSLGVVRQWFLERGYQETDPPPIPPFRD